MTELKYILEAERKAEEIIQNFGIKTPPVPVHEIVKKLNLDLIGYDLGEGISGTLVIQKGRAVLGFNPTHSKTRQRFTIAHELGHFLLHFSDNSLFVDKDFLVKYRSATSYSSKEMLDEQQANAFGAALLMPKSFVLAELRKQPSKLQEIELIEQLAKVFDVSIPAMTYRLNNIGLNLM